MRFGNGLVILTENDFIMSNNKKLSKNENINKRNMGL